MACGRNKKRGEGTDDYCSEHVKVKAERLANHPDPDRSSAEMSTDPQHHVALCFLNNGSLFAAECFEIWFTKGIACSMHNLTSLETIQRCQSPTT